MKKNKSDVVKILIFTAIVGIAANFQHPVTPSYLIEVGLDISVYGYLFAFMSIGLAVSAPTAGKFVDLKGTRIPLFSGLLIYGTSQVFFSMNSNIYMLFLCRFVAGVGVSLIFPTIISYIAKITTKKNRVKILSIQASVALFFSTVGYKIGGILSLYIATEKIFKLQAVVLYVLAFVTLVLLKNVKIKTKRVKMSLKGLLNKKTLVIILGYTLFFFASNGINKYIDVLIIDSGYSANDLGNYMLFTGVFGVITMMFILPLILKENKELKLIKRCLLVLGITVILNFAFTINLWTSLYLLMLPYFFCFSIYPILQNSYISKLDDVYQGQLVGSSESGKMFGSFLGTIFAGLVYTKNPKTMFIIMGFIYLLAFIVLIIGGKNGEKVSTGDTQ